MTPDPGSPVADIEPGHHSSEHNLLLRFKFMVATRAANVCITTLLQIARNRNSPVNVQGGENCLEWSPRDTLSPHFVHAEHVSIGPYTIRMETDV
ncbi:hypothetical protein EVAR_52951_1 [Eumeta japonica]|uniref:Uncharacterized protein n=1 Tax=Eumeta variegata TaxID=151549 RepID=A0A4C1XS54_EUMVA|nr:hypothetical protein EVAR_52951_1 [Eumeta japonica]